MNTKFVGVSIGLLLLVVPFAASAQTQTISIIQEQIQALLARLAGQQQSRGFSSTPIPVPTSPIPIAPLESDDYPGVTPPSNACPNLFITIQRGARDIMTGGQVSELQVYLADYFDLNEEDVVTGYFGKLTQKYVIEFQKKHGLPAFGIVGSLTRAKIKEVCGGTPKPGAPISVTAPNGGEKWEIDTLNTVTWAPYGYNPDINPSRDVTAYLESQVGACSGIGTDCGIYETLGKVQESGKASIHWYAGELNSAEGSAKKVSEGQYYIRVVNNVTGAWDRSDAAFSLVPKSVDLKVNGQDGPAHGGQFIYVTQSSPLIVGWFVRGGSNCMISGLALKPGVYITEAQNIPVSGSSGERTMYPVLTPPGAGYPGGIINGVSMNCTNNAGANASDYVQIDLQQPSSTSTLTVLSPNGDEKIPVDQPMVVRWQQTNISNVSIALYRNDQWLAWLEKDMKSAEKDFGLYTFVPNQAIPLPLTGAMYKIYITAQKADGSGYIDDKSDAPFSFVSGVGATRATYKAYLNDGPYPNITTQNITEADALANCKLNAADNPSLYIRCTWGDKEIFNNKPNVSLATLNPNDKGRLIVLSNGDLTVSASAQVSAHNAVRAKYGMLSGMSSTKFYWEVFVSNGPGSQGNVNMLGVIAGDASLQNPLPGAHGFGWGYGTEIGLFYPGGFTANASFPKDVSGLPSAPPLSNGWKRFAYDAGTGSLWIGDSTGWFGGGDPAAGTSPTAIAQSPKKMYPAASLYNANGAIGFAFNFGQTPFQYSPPAGFGMVRLTVPKFEEASVEKSNLASAFSIFREALKGLFGRRAQ